MTNEGTHQLILEQIENLSKKIDAILLVSNENLIGQVSRKEIVPTEHRQRDMWEELKEVNGHGTRVEGDGVSSYKSIQCTYNNKVYKRTI